MAIYVGILGILIIIAGIAFSRPSDRKINLTKLLYGAGLVSFGVLLLCWASLVNVRSGYFGVVNLNGHIEPEVLDNGWHLVNPMSKIVLLDSRTQYDIITKNEDRQGNSDTLSVVSADGHVLKVGLKLGYHIVADNAANLYTESGLAYKNKIIAPIAKDLLSKTIHSFDANVLSADKWEELQARLNHEIQNELRRHGLKVDEIIVSNFGTDNNIIRDIKEPVLLASNIKIEAGTKEISNEVKETTVATQLKPAQPVAIKRVENTATKVETELTVNTIKPQLKLSTGDISDISIETVAVVNKTDVVVAAINAIGPESNVTPETVSTDCKPMDDGSFGNVKKMLQSTGDNTYQKLTVAEKVITANCFTSDQVSDFVNLLPTQDSKLEFAKQAYLRTVDRSHYYKVASNFDKKSKKQLGKYILHLMHRTGPRTNSNEIQAVLNADEPGIYVLVDRPMDDISFEATKKLILSSGSEEKMLLTVMSVANRNSFTAEQVLEIVKLLPNPDAKLSFAEAAFKKTTNRQSFSLVAESLDSHARKMLNDYVVTLYASK